MKTSIGRSELIILVGLLLVAVAIYLLAGLAWLLLFVGLVCVAIGVLAEVAASRG